MSRFSKVISASLLLLGATIGGVSSASATPEIPGYPGDVQERYDSAGLDVLDENAFGDHIDIDLGALSVSQVDVRIPGNSALPVSLGRVLSRSTADWQTSTGSAGQGFKSWRATIPHIRQKYLDELGYKLDRCTGDFSAPAQNQLYNAVANEQQWVYRWQYFDGVTMAVGGQEKKLLRYTNSPEFASKSPRLVTRDNWIVTCVSGGATDGGESFRAVSPQGHIYDFKKRLEMNMADANPDLYDERIDLLLVTRIEDPHGNYVNYNYSGDKLSSITSNDGRTISVTWSGSKIASVTANGRTWTYTYNSAGLRKVTQPDSTYWQFTGTQVLSQTLKNIDDREDSCLALAPTQMTIRHPLGSVATYTFDTIMNGRKDMARHSLTATRYTTSLCQMGEALSPRAFRTVAVMSKQVDIPRRGIFTWTWDYEEDNGNYDDTTTTLLDTKHRTVTHPDGHKVKTYINRTYTWREGQIEKVETLDSSNNIVKTVTNTYAVGHSPGPEILGPIPNSSRASQWLNYNLTTVIDQDGDTYTTTREFETDPANANYAFGAPKKETMTSPVSSTDRITEYTYEHKTTPWVLGLSDTVTRNAKLFEDHTYDANGLRLSTKTMGSSFDSNIYTYRSDGTFASSEDALGRITSFDSFKRGIPELITLPDANTITRTVDNNGWVTSETTPRGHTYAITYDSMGRMTLFDRPGTAFDSTTVSFASLGSGTVRTVTRGDYRVITTFDGFNRPTLVQEDDTTGQSSSRYTKTDYDGLGRETFVSYPSHNSSPTAGMNTSYDALGRVTQTAQTVSPFATTNIVYLPGSRAQVTDPRAFVTTTTYESYGSPVEDINSEDVQPILIAPPIGANQETDYDIWGNPTHQRYKSGATVLAETITAYNTRLQPESVTDPAGDVEFTYYNDKDLPIVQIDGAGRKTRTTYDSRDRVEKLIKAWTGTNAGVGELNCATMLANYDPSTGYLQQCYQLNQYDANGNLTSTADAKGNTTTYTFNEIDLPVRTTFPDGSYTEVQSYDDLGNPLTTRMRGGQIHTAKYDGFSQMVAMRTPSRDTAYDFDARANRTCAAVYAANSLNLGSVIDCVNFSTGLQHRTSYAFDTAGRMLNETATRAGSSALTTSYQYDTMDNRTRITWPDSYYAQYNYDDLGRLTDVKENGTSILSFYDYDAQSRLTGITYGGNNYSGGSGTSRTELVWQIDDDLDALTHRFAGSTDVTFDYAYDGSGKLNFASVTDASWQYAPSTAATNSYGATNNLNQYSSVDGLAVSYDLNGNRTSYDGLSTPHDSENRLTGIGSAISYLYDADGRRTIKDDGSVSTQYIHAGDMEIGEYVGGSIQHRYIPGHSVDQRAAWINATAGTHHYYHANRIGSVQAVASASGVVSDQYLYTPFGIEQPLTSTGNPFRYSGRRFDPESGLFYYRARYYDPVMGRFLQTDPIGYEDQMNLYSYVGNDPLNFLDPSGMCQVSANGDAISGICPAEGDMAAEKLIDNQLSDPNSLASGVESKLNEEGLITFIDTTVVSEATDSVVVAAPDASYRDGTEEGNDRANGEVWIGMETSTVTGVQGDNPTEGPIPFTAVEAFEHEMSHVQDALDGVDTNSGSNIIDVSGQPVNTKGGGVNRGPGEARAINRTNQYRERSGLDRQRTRY